MLSYQVHRHLLSFLNSLSSQQYLNKVLGDLSDMYINISDSVASATWNINHAGGSSSLILDEAKKFDAKIDAIMKGIKEIQSRRVFNEVSNIEKACEKYSDDLSSEKILYELTSNLTVFSTTYDNYLNGIRVEDKRLALFAFLKSASLLSASLHTTANTIMTITAFLGNTTTQPETTELNGRLSILIESDMDLARFLGKLNAINTIYSELCTLVGVSYNQYPIAISKIESGSLWAEILGYPKVIALLESIIENSISYMYRTFTKEGRLASIPRKVDVIDSILELRKKLKAVGIDTTELDSHIQKASVIIAQEANQLLVGEPKVVVNDRYFTIGAELEKKYLEAGRTLLLPKVQ